MEGRLADGHALTRFSQNPLMVLDAMEYFASLPLMSSFSLLVTRSPVTVK